MSWQAAVHFSTDSLCVSVCWDPPQLYQPRDLPCKWQSLKKTTPNLVLRAVEFREVGKYRMMRKGQSVRGWSCSCA